MGQHAQVDIETPQPAKPVDEPPMQGDTKSERQDKLTSYPVADRRSVSPLKQQQKPLQQYNYCPISFNSDKILEILTFEKSQKI